MEQPLAAESDSRVSPVPFREAVWTWCRVALLSFGGPAGQIAVMHRILVDEKRWISEERFLHALNYCMVLPGPEAQQLATYIGWLMHRTVGGLVAGTLFVLPGFVSILGLSIVYASHYETAIVKAVFFGLKPAVMAIVVEAVVRIGKRVLKNPTMVSVVAAAFVAIFFLRIPFPIVILSAGLLGFLGGRHWPQRFQVIQGHAAKAGSVLPASPLTDRFADGDQPTQPSFLRSARISSVCLTLWFGPLLVLSLVEGASPVFLDEGLFFSKAAVVTFGGAYAVLAYIGQQAVERYDWLKPGEMLDGLGMAETTPGPLIMVVQFVGFMGAYRQPGSLDPLHAGILGSILTTWVTFVPCFFWIFLGAPYIERLRNSPLVSSALSTITAAVVGVVLNLAVWFSIHTLFAQVIEYHVYGIRWLVPLPSSLNLGAAIIALVSAALVLYFKRNMLVTLSVAVVLGGFWYFLIGVP